MIRRGSSCLHMSKLNRDWSKQNDGTVMPDKDFGTLPSLN
jgi:hypothetical protein